MGVNDIILLLLILCWCAFAVYAMMKKKKESRFHRYLRRTLWNKMMASAIIGVGIITALVDGDCTFLLFTLVFGVPLFFVRKDVREL